MALVSSVGGAAGPLYGTLFLQMGTASAGKEELDLAGWTEALEAGVKGVQARGKAEPGDKTMVDALLPAVEALEAAARRRGELGDALRRSADAAEEGMRATIPLEARKGRASYLGPRSVDHQDPGATSSHLLLAGEPASDVRIVSSPLRGKSIGEEKKLLSIFGAEVIGTALLILLGNGVGGGSAAEPVKGGERGLDRHHLRLGHGGHGGRLRSRAVQRRAPEPGGNVGLRGDRRHRWEDVPKYLAGEFVGAFVGATLVWAAYLPHWGATEDPGLKLACYSTAPAIRNTPANIIARSSARSCWSSACSPSSPTRDTAAPVSAGCCRSARVRHRAIAGRADGLCDQPARDLGPRIMRAPADRGQGPSDWGYAWIPVVAPIIGGILGALAFDWWYPADFVQREKGA